MSSVRDYNLTLLGEKPKAEEALAPEYSVDPLYYLSYLVEEKEDEGLSYQLLSAPEDFIDPPVSIETKLSFLRVDHKFYRAAVQLNLKPDQEQIKQSMQEKILNHVRREIESLEYGHALARLDIYLQYFREMKASEFADVSVCLRKKIVEIILEMLNEDISLRELKEVLKLSDPKELQLLLDVIKGIDDDERPLICGLNKKFYKELIRDSASRLQLFNYSFAIATPESSAKLNDIKLGIIQQIFFLLEEYKKLGGKITNQLLYDILPLGAVMQFQQKQALQQKQKEFKEFCVLLGP